MVTLTILYVSVTAIFSIHQIPFCTCPVVSAAMWVRGLQSLRHMIRTTTGEPWVLVRPRARDTLTDLAPYLLLQQTTPGPHLNIKMVVFRYGDFHYQDRTVVRPSYLWNGNSYTGKMPSLYWDNSQVLHACSNSRRHQGHRHMSPGLQECPISDMPSTRFLHQLVVWSWTLVFYSFRIFCRHEYKFHSLQCPNKWVGFWYWVQPGPSDTEDPPSVPLILVDVFQLVQTGKPHRTTFSTTY